MVTLHAREALTQPLNPLCRTRSTPDRTQSCKKRHRDLRKHFKSIGYQLFAGAKVTSTQMPTGGGAARDWRSRIGWLVAAMVHRWSTCFRSTCALGGEAAGRDNARRSRYALVTPKKKIRPQPASREWLAGKSIRLHSPVVLACGHQSQPRSARVAVCNPPTTT